MSNPIRVLHIDLSKQNYKLKVRSDLESFLGGVGVSTALLYEYFEDSGYPDHRQLAAPFAIAAGPFCGQYPGGQVVSASFVSPLMRNLGQSCIRGDLGINLKRNNIDAIFISGRFKEPSYIVIQEGEARFQEAGDLWGVDSTVGLTQLRNLYPDSAQAVIGPAGEQGVRFASVVTSGGGSFQRGGLGAVWGKKNLKAIVFKCGDDANMLDTSGQRKIRDALEVKLSDPRPDSLGSNLRSQNERTWILEADKGGLPSLNFSQVKENYEKLRRSVFSASEGGRSCRGCPVGCGNNFLYGGSFLQLDYDCLIGMGPQLGVKKKDGVFALLHLAREKGLDPVSLGSALAFLTEKNGWEFGDSGTYQSLIEAITVREEPWAKELSLGVMRAATPNSRDFAMVLSGLEMAPYFNGYLSALAQIVDAEGSFDYNLAHLLDFNELSGESAVETLVAEEKKGLLLQSLAVCPLLRSVYNTSQIFSCLEGLNFGWVHEDLEALGTKIYNLKWKLKKNLEFSWENMHFPQRLFAVPTATGYMEESNLRDLVAIYRDYVGDI